MLASPSLVYIAAVLASIGASQAGPTAANRTGLFIITNTRETPFGTLTYWGLPDGVAQPEVSAPEPKLHKRCGSNSVECDFNDNRARTNLCDNLISGIRSSGTPISPITRSICVSRDGEGTCCISWNPGAFFGEQNLVPAAQKTRDICVDSTRVSGRSVDTLLGSTCVVQCLSNRADGC